MRMGVQDFVSYSTKTRKLLTPVLYFEGEDNTLSEVALQYNDGFSMSITFALRTVNAWRQDCAPLLPKS